MKKSPYDCSPVQTPVDVFWHVSQARHPPAPTSTRVDALEKRVKKLEALVAKLRKGPIRGGGQEFYK